MKKQAGNKRTPRKRKEKEDNAYKVAAEATLFMCAEKEQVYIRVLPEAPFYDSEYAARDFRSFIAAKVVEIGEWHMRRMLPVESDDVYQKVLDCSDPYNYCDKLTDEELRSLVIGSLYILTMNYYVVDSIAKQLLDLNPDEGNVLVCLPEAYKMAR